MSGPRAGSGAAFAADEETARRRDLDDSLSRFRERFHLPPGPDGRPAIYFNGNSLGLMPKAARERVNEELEDWAALAVEGHFRSRRPWLAYHELFRDSGARLVGARPGEVVMMNTLTANLHFMMATFYRPTTERHAILIESGAFPSDAYAAASQIRHHGGDPARSLVVIRPRTGETILRTEDIEGLIEERGREIAVVLLPGVQFLTGQVLDARRLAAAAHRQGCVIGLDLAHSAGTVPLSLHDWEIDFAAWCSYKYLNAGPGAVAGCFVHERHGKNLALPRLAGWWGNDPRTRFEMRSDFAPRDGADGWQVSNPPILSLAPLLASLAIFEEAGLDRLRERSVRMTSFLFELLDKLPTSGFEVITPRQEEERGCQASLRVRGDARKLLASLHAGGVQCDFRAPDIVRVAPVPLYNTFHEIWRFVRVLEAHA